MRCEICGRPIKNAEMWQLGGNRAAPTSRSMQQLCWDCRREVETSGNQHARPEATAAPREAHGAGDADSR